MLALVLASVTAAGTIVGCGGAETKPETETESGKGENTSSEAVDDQVPAFEEIEFPDAMPANPTLAEEDYYDYDDMSVHYDITMETYNYGYPLPEDDPIKAWLEEKYNVTLNLEVVAQADQETVLSTEFASGEVPDVVTLPSKEYGFTLGEQGILVDAKELYPYMPQTCKFVTKDLVKYSTMEDGTMPFTTKYAVQDGDIWNLAIRQDWLDKFLEWMFRRQRKKCWNLQKHVHLMILMEMERTTPILWWQREMDRVWECWKDFFRDLGILKLRQ